MEAYTISITCIIIYTKWQKQKTKKNITAWKKKYFTKLKKKKRKNYTWVLGWTYIEEKEEPMISHNKEKTNLDPQQSRLKSKLKKKKKLSCKTNQSRK